MSNSFEFRTVRRLLVLLCALALSLPLVACDAETPATAGPYGCVTDLECQADPIPDKCVIGHYCENGNCHYVMPRIVVCDTSNDTPCTHNVCESATGCGIVPRKDGIACNDGDACTDDGVCTAGTCGGGKNVCK